MLPEIYLQEALDKTDELYLNDYLSPVVTPLKNTLQLEMYNTKLFRQESKNFQRM